MAAGLDGASRKRKLIQGVNIAGEGTPRVWRETPGKSSRCVYLATSLLGICWPTALNNLCGDAGRQSKFYSHSSQRACSLAALVYKHQSRRGRVHHRPKMSSRASTGSFATPSRTAPTVPQHYGRRSESPGYLWGDHTPSEPSRAPSVAPSDDDRSRPTTSRASTATTPRRRSRGPASVVSAGESFEVICAVGEARGVSPSVGLAFVNITTGQAILTQINDTQFYSKTNQTIEAHGASKVLFAETPGEAGAPSNKPLLLSYIEDSSPGVELVASKRRDWSEAAGLEFVQALAFREETDAIMVALEGKFYATTSFSAVSSLSWPLIRLTPTN